MPRPPEEPRSASKTPHITMGAVEPLDVLF